MCSPKKPKTPAPPPLAIPQSATVLDERIRAAGQDARIRASRGGRASTILTGDAARGANRRLGAGQEGTSGGDELGIGGIGGGGGIVRGGRGRPTSGTTRTSGGSMPSTSGVTSGTRPLPFSRTTRTST